MDSDQTGTIDETTTADGADSAILGSDSATDQDHATGADTATQAGEEQDSPSSSTTPQPTESTTDGDEFDRKALAPEPVAPAAPTPAVPPEIAALLKDPVALAARLKHNEHLEKLHARQAAELGQVRKEREKWQGIDPDRAKDALAAQERTAKQANLNPWNRDHPQHRQFVAVRDGIRRDLKRLDRVSPDQREAVKASLFQDYSPEERAQFDGYEKWRQDEESMAPEDREDRYREMARNEALEAVKGFVQAQEHHRAANEFVAKHGDILHQDPEEVARILDPSQTSRRDLAVQVATLKAQLAAATGARAKDLRVVETAKAREQTSRSAAVVSRDGGAKRRPNAVAEAMKIAGETGEDVADVLFRLHESAETEV